MKVFVELKEELEAQSFVEERKRRNPRLNGFQDPRHQQNFIRIGNYGSKFGMFWKGTLGNV